MIEKLPHREYINSSRNPRWNVDEDVMVDKINEIIDAVNRLEEELTILHKHYYSTIETAIEAITKREQNVS